MTQIAKPELIWKYKGESILVSDMQDIDVIKAKKIIDQKVLFTKAKLKTLERIQDSLNEEITLRMEENETMEELSNQIKSKQNVKS